jgi:pilus assembly protein TadC
MNEKTKFKVPFALSDIDRLRKKSKFFAKYFKYRPKSKIQTYLNSSDTGIMREEYLGICLRSALLFFIFFYLFSSTLLFFIKVKGSFLLAIPLSLIFAGFIYFSQEIYPKVYASRKQREIEKNLIPALEDMLVQLNSGVPLFSILVNISTAEYGFLSSEFRKAVKKINAGLPQTEVLEEVGEKNPSLFFRRALWQISNGLRAGSDISIVISESIKSLNEEQLIQIQNYGNKLNPLIMFYMLISVIIPALSITFLTIISSMINLAKTTTMLLFASLFIFVVLIQIMFLGTIKSVRPSLL